MRAVDASNNTFTGYTGTIHFTSTDGQAVLPANYTFVAGDGGSHTFTNGVTLKTAGTQTVSVNDTVTTSKTGTSGNIVVPAGAATQLVLSGATTNLTQGATRQFTATAKDAFGNTDPNYTATVTFAQTGGSGTVTGLGTSTAAAGVATKTVTGNHAGSVTLQASSTSPSFTSNTLTFTVDNVAPTVTLTGPTTANEGQLKSYSFSLTDPGTGETFSVATRPAARATCSRTRASTRPPVRAASTALRRRPVQPERDRDDLGR